MHRPIPQSRLEKSRYKPERMGISNHVQKIDDCSREQLYENFPRTGVIRSYDFTISRGLIAPDGYQRDALLVKGASPGPPIGANWGDTIQVTVHNNISDAEEGVALHWHGFLHHGKPWEGRPRLRRRHRRANSHIRTSNEEVRRGRWSIMLSDWYHKDYFTLVEETMKPDGGPFKSDTSLINGKANFDCTKLPADDKTPCSSIAGLATFRFKRGRTHRLRLINSGCEALQRFTITMTVIANDFVSVEPYDTKVVTLGIGQRTDVLVKRTPGAQRA
ncbi:Lcc1, ascorbase & Cu-oxidase [Metarhizium album ARSEF 1941]|uniref:Lcc1, ascorbase & Cu-oxidase n=1 Tax=Metarhizium album (strain ARSEF 1941) TaxID=1081103 RepID=A0A0B2WYG6_METAS|nr:Lcc1, ascorbase & Cu-oxidase [Metarhizium album ARSEF 1941]KHO01292.1 Lcc1, ascorbase & Cu-oxidase [Metarhizium album ARSEF 1941]